MTIQEKEFELEMTWVGDESNDLHLPVPDDLLEEAKSRAKGGTRDIRVIRIIVCLNTFLGKSFRHQKHCVKELTLSVSIQFALLTSVRQFAAMSFSLGISTSSSFFFAIFQASRQIYLPTTLSRDQSGKIRGIQMCLLVWANFNSPD